MKLWRRVSGAMKDKNSLWLATISRRTSTCHPYLEAAVIKATNHDDLTLDYNNFRRVFKCLRSSPSSCLNPLLHALSRRLIKTRSWVVSLKCLLLLHGIFCCKLQSVKRICRLPFDLSTFFDANSTWAYTALVRVYFAFLNQRVAYQKSESELEGDAISIGEDLSRIKKWQHLLDLLIQIKPISEGMTKNNLVLEAMDCVIIEIFDVYGSICRGIARILVGIYEAKALEASMALGVLKKATLHGQKLSVYFEFCREIGVLNAKEFPDMERFPQGDIEEVELIIQELLDSSKKNSKIEQDCESTKRMKCRGLSQTVITNNWEVFHDDLKKVDNERMMMFQYRDLPDLIAL